MKRVLITAGQVYGKLDDNKIVGNRIRGIWALRFAEYLALHDWRDQDTDGYRVTVLVPDTMARSHIDWHIGKLASSNVRVIRQNGFEDYQEKCLDFAATHDCAVMAAAVVNWIPAEPFSGKMPTKGYQEGDRIDVPFVLAPRVINAMRKVNPKLTLIGCKMLIGSERGELVGAAEDVLRASKAHVVLANDQADLHTKLLVFPDRTVIDLPDLQHANEWEMLYEHLRLLIEDRHWHTEVDPDDADQTAPSSDVNQWLATTRMFDAIARKYRDRFASGGGDLVFGSLLVPLGDGQGYFVSPRTKTALFSSKDAVWVASELDEPTRAIFIGKPGAKATLNAPLLVRMAQTYPGKPVLHLHEQLPDVPTMPYAPPGTDRDSLRDIPGPAFNIEGHGFVSILNNMEHSQHYLEVARE